MIINIKIAKERLNGLDQYLEEAIIKRAVPALGISIVFDDEIIYAKGFGFRDIKKKIKTTENTIFPIGSTTKSFTTTAIALLIQDGLLEWNRPIREFCSEFRFKDPYVNEHVTIRDILGHRTGLPGHNFVWFGFEPDITYMDKIRFLDSNEPFRSTFQYCSVNYCATAELIEHLTGKSYFEFVQKRIFDPLRMERTFHSREETKKSDDYATLYTEKDGKIVETADFDLKFGRGSGNINSTAIDMAKFLKFHLNKGKVNRKELVSEDNLIQTHLPTSISGLSFIEHFYPDFKEVHYPSYALGWECESYRGNRIISHGGSYTGCCHTAAFLPDLNIGIDILTNTLDSFLGHILHYHIIDRLLGMEQIDYVAIDEKIMAKVKPNRKKRKHALDEMKIENTTPSHSLEEYIGEYHHPAYSTFEFILKDEALIAKFGIHTCEVKHLHYETFAVKIDLLDTSILVSFETNQKGNVHGLKIKTEPTLEPAFFKKREV
ncbi:MAG: serine hydrolase [Candidatus Thorarchaeota archaeon]